MTALSIDELLEKAKARHHPHSGECVTCELIATLESVRDAEKGMTKADELFKKYQAHGWIGPTSFKAALREYGALVRREWVGLTENEAFVCRGRDYFETYKAIETKLKEKNNG